MDKFESVWSILIVVIPTIVGVVTLIVQATPSPKDDNVWGKIALVLGRLFGAKTFADENGKSTISVPVLQSAKPKAKQ